ncbi:MAG TPA: hypothetical protein VL944_00490 [Candidatus Acidoferrum sp.]|nr:hypothetical protein [Candidatus Acidoferrum sp.]
MPLKHNVTKYDVLATRIHKLALKNSTGDLTKDEKRAMVMAVLIASFSSSLSWKTHNILADGQTNLNNEEVKREYKQALASRWKLTTAADISEVLNKGISSAAFSAWLFFNVDQSQHSLYKDVWSSLGDEFMQACDDIEVMDERALK